MIERCDSERVVITRGEFRYYLNVPEGINLPAIKGVWLQGFEAGKKSKCDCPSCHRNVDENDIYCSWCGKKLKG